MGSPLQPCNVNFVSTPYPKTKIYDLFFSTLVKKAHQGSNALFLPYLSGGLQVSQEGDFLVFVEKLGLLTTQNGTQQVGWDIFLDGGLGYPYMEGLDISIYGGLGYIHLWRVGIYPYMVIN